MLHMPSPMLLTPPASGPAGQQVFTASQSWTVPAGVTMISAVAIGNGRPAYFDEEYFAIFSGAGGDLAWHPGIAVTPGETLYIEIGRADIGGSSRIARDLTDLLRASGGAAPVGQTRFQGGQGRGASVYSSACPGGGAGGYSGAGTQGAAGSYKGGGGSSLLGGSGAGASGGIADGTAGMAYGGGQGCYSDGYIEGGSAPGPGAVRIIWGEGRAYPNTNVGDV